MDLITVLSFTIFGATVITIVMALVSYGAFKMREFRKPRAPEEVPTLPQKGTPAETENLFFVKYVPPREERLERETRT